MNTASGRGFASVLLSFFSYFTCAGEPEHVGSLISACSDGQMEICDQINELEHPARPVDILDAMALAFANRSGAMKLEKDKIPDLDKAYPLIIRDYFSSGKIAEKKRKKWFKEASLENCGQHYHVRWRMEKNWWPADKDENPDWRAIYPHVLDHYFGSCVSINNNN